MSNITPISKAKNIKFNSYSKNLKINENDIEISQDYVTQMDDNILDYLSISQDQIKEVKTGTNGSTILILNDGTKKIYKTDELGNLIELYTYSDEKNYTPNTVEYFEYNESGNIKSIVENDYVNKTKTSSNFYTGGIASVEVKDFYGNIISSGLDYSNYEYMNALTENNISLKELDGTSIVDILGQDRIDEINNDISEAVKNCSTNGEKVALAASILIASLAEDGYYMPYYYGGGHGDLTNGVNPNIGETTTATGESTQRNIKSYDCSGLVNWAIRVAIGDSNGDWSYTGGTTDNYVTTEISRTETNSGDVYVDSGHMFLVLDTYTDSNGINHTIAAESHCDGWRCDNNSESDDGIEIVDYITDDIRSSFTSYSMDSFYENIF